MTKAASPRGQHVAYIRVSSSDQNPARQYDRMKSVTFDEVFEEKASAKDRKRPVLKDCLRHLRKGDTLHIASLDRFARSLTDLESLIDELTGHGVQIVSHKESLTFSGDTDSMSRLLMHIIGAVSEFERSLIKERQREGIKAAQAAGKHLGRPNKLSNSEVEELRERANAGEPKSSLAKEFNISRTTLYKLLGEAGTNDGESLNPMERIKGRARWA